MNDINNEIGHRVSAFVSELTAVVPHAAVDAVADVLGSAKPRGARTGATTVSSAKPSRAFLTRGKRTPERITATLDSVLGYIKSHANVHSEMIRVALKLPKPVMLDSLARLRDAKKIKMRGMKRAATYSAA